ncbi:MAG: sterol desaturase family protein [Crocinitomicaceae bacterium]
MNKVQEHIQPAWEAFVNRFTHFDSRLNWLYLISSIALAFFFLAVVSYRKHGSLKPFLILQEIFDRKVWFHKSALVDYQIFFFNTVILGLLIIPFFVSAMMILDGTKNQMIIWFGEPEVKEVNAFWIVVFYTVIIWLISDFSRFLLHFLLHKIPFLWRIHEVHHSAEVLTPVTQYRMHPIEMILFYFRGIFVLGIVSGVYLYYYPFVMKEEGYLMVFGVNIFRFAFLFIGSNLRHSQIPVKFPPVVEYIFISPYQHQVHHSKDQKHFDKNFGSHLAIWDWMFRSLVRSKEVEKVEYGIPDGNPHKSVLKAYFQPFRRMLKKMKNEK